jgi:hypothetical protein
VSLNAIATPAAEQIEPRLGRFGVPLVKRDGFLGGVRADADHHQQAHFVLLQPDLEVDSVDPAADVVGPCQRVRCDDR